MKGFAVIGLSTLWVTYLVLRKTGLRVWAVVIVWNALSIWDSVSAYIVNTTNPWPDFFMLHLFGSSMFLSAVAMNVVIIKLSSNPEAREKMSGDHHNESEMSM